MSALSIYGARSEQNTLDAFQLKMLRRILMVPSTCIDREWTNQHVIDTLTQRVGYKHVTVIHKLDGSIINRFAWAHFLRVTARPHERSPL